MMPNDESFRVAMIVVFLVLLPIGMYHRIKSQSTGESLDRRQEGLFILATLRPAGLALALGLIAFLIDPSWMAWSSLPLPRAVRTAGIVLMALACGLLFWTFHTLGPNLTDTVVTRKQHTLVTHGPYRWVRHPFYGFVALLVLGSSLAAANWFVLAAGVALFTLMIIRTRTEEEKLIARFGDAYQTYMNQTGRFFPKRRTR